MSELEGTYAQLADRAIAARKPLLKVLDRLYLDWLNFKDERTAQKRMAQREYYATHREQISARHKIWYAANREEQLAKQRVRYHKTKDLKGRIFYTPEEARERVRANQKRYYARHHERLVEKARQRYHANRERYLANARARYRAKKK